MKPRPYQAAAVAAAMREHETLTATLLDMATGTGKTFTYCLYAKYVPGRTLILEHTEELVGQALRKAREVMPEGGAAVEQRERRAWVARSGGLFGDEPAKAVVASVKTITRRLARWPADAFDLVVCDEAHHFVRKNSDFWRILRHFAAPPLGGGTAKVLGVSGSLDRADGEALGGIFESVAYRYHLPDGIRDGWLVEPDVYRVDISDVILDAIRGREGIAPTEIDRRMKRGEYAFGVARAVVDAAGDARRAVAFAPNGAQARMMADAIRTAAAEAGRAGAVGVVLGEDREERRAALADFAAGRVRHLVTCDVLTEGWDSDQIDIVALKPTGSRAKAAQMVGRGTRPLAALRLDSIPDAAARRAAIARSAKPRLIVLDPGGCSEVHSLVHAADIHDGRVTPEGSGRLPPKGAGPPPRDPDAPAARASAIAAESERAGRLSVSVRYTLTPASMMDHLGVKPRRCPRALLGRPATESQCRFLEGRGVAPPAGLGFWEATEWITEIRKREAAGPPTERQAETLRRFAYSTPATRAEAKRLLDALAANGWRRPDEPVPL